MKPKVQVGTRTKVVRKPRFFLTNDQRTQIKLAKLKTKAGKSAISEAGRTIRDVAGQITAQQAYKTYANKEIAKQASQKINANNIDNAIDLYNRLIAGNADQEGESGKTSTTEVGGAGSAIGG